MSEEALQEFYKYVLLPQFGLENVNIVWQQHEAIEPADDHAHYFAIGEEQYVLLFKDYGEFSDGEIKEVVKLPNGTFNYINPTSQTDHPPAYSFSLPAPYKYASNITGSFTLLSI